MRILIFGAGAIGSIYGYFLSDAGNEVVHCVREGRTWELRNGLHVSILDWRSPKDVRQVDSTYHIRTISNFTTTRQFDLILVSIKHGSLNEAVGVLEANKIQGDILFFNGIWKDYSSLDSYLPRDRYLWGYPVAGGNVDYANARLEGAILDNVLLS
ncbi:MAG: 2-dehydropantoate 2-reductase N-terminal domain-containing protein, partial [Spirochaetia bacterium]